MQFLEAIRLACAYAKTADRHYPGFSEGILLNITTLLVTPEELRTGDRSLAAMDLLYTHFDKKLVDELYVSAEDLKALCFRDGGLAMGEHYFKSVLTELSNDQQLDQFLVNMAYTARSEFERAREIAARFTVVQEFSTFICGTQPAAPGVTPPVLSVSFVHEWCAHRYHIHFHDETRFAPDPLVGNEWALELRALVIELARYTSNADWVAGWPQLENGNYDLSAAEFGGQFDFVAKFRRAQEMLRDQTVTASNVHIATALFSRHLPQRWCVNAGNPVALVIYGHNPAGRFMVE